MISCSRPNFANKHVFKGKMLLQKLWAFLDWQEVPRNRNCHKNAAKSTREKKKQNSKFIQI